MNPDYQELIHRHLDDSLSSEQQAQLNEWIKSDPKNARQFASSMMLHDRLRSELTTAAEDAAKVVLPNRSQSGAWGRWPFALASTACAVLLAVSLLWQAVDTPSASAAIVELNRIIEASDLPMDRTFLISVLDAVIPPKHQDRHSPERQRPPKPPLDGAVLDVRGPDQFVLKRQTGQGESFVTGSNGTTSWAVRPDGPVRYSNDLFRFARDLPGHEDGLPINNLHDGLEALRTAYDLEMLPEEDADPTAERDGETYRRMIAVKKPGFRGATRVEIRYAESSGQIYELRFVQMSYGPQQITLTMTAIEEESLPDDYFRPFTPSRPRTGRGIRVKRYETFPLDCDRFRSMLGHHARRIASFAQPPTHQRPPTKRVGKPRISDTVKANVYADNWFTLYINGEHVAVDSIKFMPHNVVSVDILPAYSMTIAVMAKDNADSKPAWNTPIPVSVMQASS